MRHSDGNRQGKKQNCTGADLISFGIYRDAAAAYYATMVGYVSKLKGRHEEIKHQAQGLLRALRKEGVLSKP